jgi:hypothetical protein
MMSFIARRLAALTTLGIILGCTDGTSAAVAKARAGDPAPLCHAVCERVSTCNAVEGFEGVQACTTRCTADEALWADPCREAVVGLSACELQRSCDELRSILVDVERAPTAACEAERQATLSCPPLPEHRRFISFQF